MVKELKELQIDYHQKTCDICFDMAQRGIEDEVEYWDIMDYDKFNIKYPVIYRLFYIPKKGKNKGVREYFNQP